MGVEEGEGEGGEEEGREKGGEERLYRPRELASKERKKRKKTLKKEKQIPP